MKKKKKEKKKEKKRKKKGKNKGKKQRENIASFSSFSKTLYPTPNLFIFGNAKNEKIRRGIKGF